MSKEIIIKNGLVFDPKNNVNGEKKDILVSNGKIVDKLSDEAGAEVIDASGKVVMPGAIELSSKLFSVESAFLKSKELYEKDITPVPKLLEISKQYINNGFTFLSEYNVPMTQSRMALNLVRENLLLDHALIMDFGSNWTFFTDIQAGDHEKNIGVMFIKMLADLKGLSFSIELPYHGNFVNKGREIPHPIEKIPLFNFKPEDAFINFIKAYDYSKLKPSMFIMPYHTECLECEGEHLELLSSLKGTKFVLRNANHVFMSDVDKLVDFYLANKEFELSVSPLILGVKRPLSTRDKNVAIKEAKRSDTSISSIDLEFDSSYYITTRDLTKLDATNASIWNAWLEILLKLKEKNALDRIALTSNAPMNMCIADWPKVFNYLLNPKSREGVLKGFGDDLSKYNKVAAMDTKLDLTDIAALISYNPAKLLSLDDIKGHLGVGADADIVVFNIDPNAISGGGADAEKAILEGFGNSWALIKSGIILKKEGRLSESAEKGNNEDGDLKIGKIYWTNADKDEEFLKKIFGYKESFFRKHYSMYYDEIINPKEKDVMIERK
ncbi:MAG: amidohydrolase family protein [Promethearchaeota archaeon]